MKTAETIQKISCLKCGGQMKFDPATQNTVCLYCSSIEENTSGKLNKLNCPNCAAELTIIAGTPQAECKSCEGTFSVIQEDDAPCITNLQEHQKYIAPFTLSKDDYQRSMISWLTKQRNAPTNLFNKMAVIDCEGCYVPYYYCTVDYDIQWSASVGHDRVETYTGYTTKVVNGKKISTPVTKTRTVTDWTPFSSASKGRFALSCAASGYIQNTENKITDLLKSKRKINFATKVNEQDSFELDSNLENYISGNIKTRIDILDSKYTAGFNLLPFEGEAGKSFDQTKANNKIYAQIKREAPGDKIQNLTFRGNLEKEFYALFKPFWITKYSYDAEVYLNICNGNEAAKHTGNTPVCADQKKTINKMFYPFWFSLCVVVLLFISAAIMKNTSESISNLLTTIGGFSVLTAVILIISGFIRKSMFIKKNKTYLEKESTNYINNPALLFNKKSKLPDPTK